MTAARPPDAGSGGVTLVELLAAIVVSALVIALAGRIFLSGNKQLLRRIADSDRLSDLIKLKGALQRALKEDITSCAGGRISIRLEAKDHDLAKWVRARYPFADTLDFRCYEVESESGTLVEWQGISQPSLVEYRMAWKGSRQGGIRGSWLK